jgi:Tfp pilus assembly PilM family ATPase
MAPPGAVMTSTLISGLERRLRLRASSLLGKDTVSAGIDAGSEKVKVAVVSAHHGRPVIHTLIDEPSGLSESTAAMVNQKCTRRVSGLSGHEVRTYVMEFPPMPRDDLEVVIRRNVSQSLHRHPVVSFETRPGSNSRLEVMAVASSGALVSEVFREFSGRGICLDAAYADVLALAECARVTRPEVGTMPVCVFNMGATWSHLVLLVEGNLVFSRTMKMGINSIISRAAELCGMSVEEARELVFRAGIAGTIDSHDEDDLLGRTYAESVRDIIEQFTVEIQRSLAFTAARRNLPAPEALLVCGGATTVPGMLEVLSRETGLAVDVLNPLEAMALGDDCGHVEKGSLFCVAVGLALLGLRGDAPGLLPDRGREESDAGGRVRAGLAVCLMLLVMMAVGSHVLNSIADRYKQATASESGFLHSVLMGPGGLDPQESRLPARADVYSALTGKSPRWADVLKVLSGIVPEGVVFDEIVFTTDGEGSGSFPVWTLAASGTVTDMGRASGLLAEMRGALEDSDLFKDVEVLPQGLAGNADANGSQAVSISFLLEACLE